MEGKWAQAAYDDTLVINVITGEAVGWFRSAKHAEFAAQAPAMATKLEATHQYLREQGHDEMADEIEALLTAIKGE